MTFTLKILQQRDDADVAFKNDHTGGGVTIFADLFVFNLRGWCSEALVHTADMTVAGGSFSIWALVSSVEIGRDL